jgi:outer membrane protein assembly factor BamB
VWTVNRLGRGWSSPIIVGNRLYITGDVENDLVIHALDLEGKIAWQVKNGKTWRGDVPGARATCAYADGRLYHMNAHGRVACLDAADGKELWAVDVLQRFGARNITWAMSECLLVDGPRLLVTPGGSKGLMAALDRKDGRTIWTTPPIPDERPSYCSPILFRFAGRNILANCTSHHAFGVDADTGSLLWKVPLHNPYGATCATPTYGNGRVFYVAAFDRSVCCQLQAGSEGLKVAEAWTSTTLDTVTGSGIFLDGAMYISGYRKLKSWLCVDWQTGQIRYELKALTTGAAVHAEQRLYCLAEDGRAALLKPGAGAYEVAGEFRVVQKRVHDAWAHPVMFRGRLYLRYHDTLWCFDVRAR